MTHLWLSANSNCNILAVYLNCCTRDPRASSDVLLLRVAAHSERGARDMFALTRNSCGAKNEDMYDEWSTSWRCPLPNRLALCSDELRCLRAALSVGEYWHCTSISTRAMRIAHTLSAVRELAPLAHTFISALRSAKRADEVLFRVDADMCEALRTRGICKVDALGWFYKH